MTLDRRVCEVFERLLDPDFSSDEEYLAHGEWITSAEAAASQCKEMRPVLKRMKERTRALKRHTVACARAMRRTAPSNDYERAAVLLMKHFPELGGTLEHIAHPEHKRGIITVGKQYEQFLDNPSPPRYERLLHAFEEVTYRAYVILPTPSQSLEGRNVGADLVSNVIEILQKDAAKHYIKSRR